MKKSLFYVSVLSFAMLFTGCSGNAANKVKSDEMVKTEANKVESDEIAKAEEDKVKSDEIAKTEEDKVKPDEIVKAATDKLAEAESYKMVMDMNCNIDAAKESLKMGINIDMNVCTKPKQMVENISKTKIETAGQTQEVETKIYTVENEDKSFTVYTYLNGAWQKSTVESKEQAGIQDAQKQMSTYLQASNDYKLVGEKDVNNVKCYEVDLEISYEKLKDILAAMGSAGSMEQLIGDAEFPEGGFTMTFFVSKEDQSLVRYSIDLSDFMKSSYLQSGASEKDIKEILFTTDVTLQDVNSVEAITVPEEALAVK